jgi:hypothetical protein
LSVVATLIERFGLAPHDAERHAPRVVATSARNRPTLIDELRAAASGRSHERHM